MTHQERYRRRDGARVGGLGPAELVNVDSAQPVIGDHRRALLHIDAAYREWTRNRSDVDRLRRQQEAISSYLEPDSAGVN